MATETRTTPLGAALALAAVLAAALASGCDGGIFGTGDGSSDGLPVDAADTSPTLTAPSGSGAPLPEASDPEEADTAVDASPADGVSTEPTAPAEPTNLPLFNLLATNSSANTPRLRVVNAGSSDVALESDADAPEPVAVPAVAPGTASDYVTVPDGVSSLLLGYPTTPDGAVLEGARRLGPLTLVPSSVTTLLVRDGQLAVPEIVALPTRVASDDSTLALVRLLPGGGIGPDDGPLPAERYTLVSDGANPGGVDDVELGRVALGGPVDAGYVAVPAGDYRLDSSASAVPARLLSFPGGAVRTLVVLESGELLVIADGG